MQLALDDPSVLRVELVRGLRALAAGLESAGDGPGGLAARDLLVRVLQPSGGRSLAVALRELAAAHAAAGDLEGAVGARGRSFRLLESLARADERLWPEVLADAEEYTVLLHQADRTTDAAVVSRRVVRALALLLAEGREGLRPEYARSLRLWGDRLAADEEWAEAVTAVRESVAEFQRLGDRHAAVLGLSRISSLHTVLDDLEGALAAAREALAEGEELERSDPDGDWRTSVCAAAHDVARRLSALDRDDEALDTLVSLREGFARLYEEAPETAGAYAAYLEDLAAAHAVAGSAEEALRATEDLVDLHRAEHARFPDAPGRDLAFALLQLVDLHRALGDVGRAVAAAEETVRLLRGGDDELELVHALCVLSDHLAMLDGPDDGLDAAEEAVSAARGADAGRPLGEALLTLGNRLEDRDDPQGALAAAAEAVEAFRAAGEPADWLAPSLFNRGTRARLLGLEGQALASALEAVALYQELYEDDLSYSLVLAEALCLLGRVREDQHRFEHAITSMERAISLLERISHPDFPQATTALAAALHDASRYHEKIGGLDRSLELMRRAIALYGELASAEPDRFRAMLAGAWRSLGIYLGRLGQTEEAFSAALFDVDLHREIGDLPNLAQALRALGHHHEALGRRDEAVAVTRESLAVYEELHLLDDGPRFAGRTAVVTSRLAALLPAEDAVPLRRRAVELFAEADRPDDVSAELTRLLHAEALAGLDVEATVGRIAAHEEAAATVRSLNGVADRLLADGALAEADAIHTRASALWEILLLEHPDAPDGPAVSLLETEASLRARLGLPGEAAAAQARALATLEPLLDPASAEHDGALARVLVRLASYLADAGRPAEALPHQARATDLYESLATRSHHHRRALASALSALADLQDRTGSPDAARTRARAKALSSALADD